jgi:hypothetical protein
MADAAAFEDAVTASQQALAEYQAGLLDGDELRHVLDRVAVVVDGDRVWRLDVDRGRWSQLECIPDDTVLDARTIRRWQAGLRDLLSSLRATAD